MRQLVTACVLVAGLAAQDPVAGPDWTVPIHTNVADPVGGDYGIWASGPDYKVSFHDGVAFYPVLGTAYPENLPLVWRTESIEVDGRSQVDTRRAVRQSHDDWRYEFHYDGVVEAYDVRRDGVEQTFVLTAPPTDKGDLVVTGAIESRLSAADVASRHGAIVFHDDRGNPIVQYGAATAFDASGDTIPMRTSFADGRIRITVDGAWLDRAVYPVTLDPLTSSVVWSIGADGVTDIANGKNDMAMRIDTRAFSASDFDLLGYLVDDDLGSHSYVYSDITINWSTKYAQAAYVAGASYNAPFTRFGRYVVAMQRDFSTQSLIRAYTHDGDSTIQNSGYTLFHTAPTGVSQLHPSVGGTEAGTIGNFGLIAYEYTGQGTNGVECMTVNASSLTTGFGNPKRLASASTGTIHNEWPCVQRVSDGGTEPWMVVWNQESISFQSAWVRGGIVDWQGTPLWSEQLVFLANSSDRHTQPKIAGGDGRFLLMYELNDTEIQLARVDWPSSAIFPTVAPAFTLDSGLIMDTGYGRPIAYDRNTSSHWGVAYSKTDLLGLGQVHVHRLGYEGGIVESSRAFDGTISLAASGYGPSLTHNPGDQEFLLTFRTSESKTYGRRMQYNPVAASTAYGNGCAGTIASRNNGLPLPPYAGSEFLSLDLTGGAANAPSVLVLAGLPAAVTLPSGCSVNVSGPLVSASAGTSNASGDLSSATFPLPSAFNGDLYWQWFQIDPQTNALVSSPGLQTTVF